MNAIANPTVNTNTPKTSATSINKPAQPNSVIEQTLVMHKLINLKTLKECTGLSTSTIYDILDPKSKRYDKTFPKQVRITANRVGWVAQEVNDWIEERMMARNV